MFKRRGLIPQSSSVAGDKQTVLKLPRRIDDAFAFYCGGLTGCSAMQNRAARKRDTACGKANSCTRLHTRIFFSTGRWPFHCGEEPATSCASRVSPSLGARVDVMWKDVELFAVQSWRARTRASAGYCCDDDDCATRSGGAATQLSRMPKRTVVRGTRALARAACKTCTAK